MEQFIGECFFTVTRLLLRGGGGGGTFFGLPPAVSGLPSLISVMVVQKVTWDPRPGLGVEVAVGRGTGGLPAMPGILLPPLDLLAVGEAS